MLVYIITNKINGKRYVGQTVRTIKARWSAHCNPNSQCAALIGAIKKYGKKNFEIKTLSKCNTLEEANHRESYYIKLFNTIAPNGYNLTFGGDGHSISEETRKKLSGRTVSQETRKKISIAFLGKSNPTKGTKLSPERIQKIIDNTPRGLSHPHFGKPMLEKNRKFFDRTGLKHTSKTIEKKREADPRKRGIVCIQTEQKFRSIREAGRQMSLDSSGITKVLKGKYSHLKGYTFKYI